MRKNSLRSVLVIRPASTKGAVSGMPGTGRNTQNSVGLSESRAIETVVELASLSSSIRMGVVG